MTETDSLQYKPLVAIVGRPNVGKSTLFNRLSDRKQAIVIDEPGATRDRNYTDASWGGKGFMLVDTGGFEPASNEKILVQMREQTNLAIEEADIIIFLMDGREGLTPSDLEIARMLRQINKPVYYTINKIDGPKHEALALEFYRLGIETYYPISAQHGSGVAELLDDITVHIKPSAEDETDEEQPVRIAVIGKPNVGKSSLVNKILGVERTIVNPLPGTTRDAIDTPFTVHGRKYLLIDTAGIRKKSKVSLVLEKYSVIQALKTLTRCEIALLLIDAKEGITEQDAKIAGLAFERGVACIIVINKWDTVEKDNSSVGTYVEKIKDQLKFLDYAPIIFVSAITGQRVMKIFDLIDDVYSQYTKRISTSELNRAAREFIDRNPPPLHHNKPNALGYMTQVSVKPPTFVLFVREPKAIHFSYERYLMNRLRETFGFDHSPVRLFFKKKSK
jgi:GTP-binding protein